MPSFRRAPASPGVESEERQARKLFSLWFVITVIVLPQDFHINLTKTQSMLVIITNEYTV